MEYARLVRLRTSLWNDFETRLAAARRGGSLSYGDLETLAHQFRQVLHDHALVRARYPETGSARRLQRLALEGTHWLQWDRADRIPGLVTFLFRTFPRAFRRQTAPVGLAAALFAAAFLFGISLALAQPGAGPALLGPQAVERLKGGHLWTESLVGTVPPAVSSSAIATNNMAVALAGWAGGAVAGVGSLYVVLLNGFLLGLILATTVHYSLAGSLLAFVAAHGPLEITLILCTAGAGLGLGRALVVADDRPRREVLGEASRDAIVILVGCLPWFLVLGVVEGFISPAVGVPVALKVALGAALEAVFLALAWNPLLEEKRS